MIVGRPCKAGIIIALGYHTFRATGITVYLLNGGLLEDAQQMAAHESARTTRLYDRRNDQVRLDQVERIVLWVIPSDLPLSARPSAAISGRIS